MSFSTQGATPFQNLGGTTSPFQNMSGSTSPYSKALDTASSAPRIGVSSIPALQQAGIIAPLPTQPVKKQTVTTASGDTHVTEYHPPTPGILSSTPPVDNSGGTSNPNYLNFQMAGTGPQGTPLAPSTSTQAPGTAAPQNPYTQQSLLAQQQALIQKQNAEQADLAAKKQALETNFTNMNAGILSQPGELGYQTGRQAQLQQTEQTGLADLSGEQAQLAAYEQPQLAALGSAAQSLTPSPAPYGQTAFYPSTGTYGAGNTPGSGQSSQTGIQSSDSLYPQVQYWAEQVKNGLPVTSLPAPFNNGVIQTQIQQLAGQGNSGYSPISTAANTAGIINQNITTGNQYAGSATQVQNTLNTVQQLTPQINSFMQANNINTGANAPIWTTPINTFLKNVGNPGAISSWNLYSNELNNLTEQLIQTKGVTPTGAEAQILSQDPSSLTYGQLQTYLQTLNNVGATYQTQQAGSATQAYGANSGKPSLYTGGPAAAQAPVATPVAPANAGAKQNPALQAGGGILLNLLGAGQAAAAAVGGLFESIFSKL